MKIIPLPRPKLNSWSIEQITRSTEKTNVRFIFTLSPGQWDNLLDEAYFRQDALLIEVNSFGLPIAYYKKTLSVDSKTI